MNLQFIFSTGLQAAADNDPDTFSPSLATPQEYGPLLQESVGVVNVMADPPVGQLSPGRIRYLRSLSFKRLLYTTPRSNGRWFHEPHRTALPVIRRWAYHREADHIRFFSQTLPTFVSFHRARRSGESKMHVARMLEYSQER